MRISIRFALFFLGIILAPALFAQDSTLVSEDKVKPDQLDIIKLNVLQLGINEARLLYEHQVGRASSIEAGLGYIYPNRFWYDRGGATMLTDGVGVYLGFRKYVDKKRYIYQPLFRSYTSLMAFARFNGFDDEWLLFGSDIYGFQCEQFSMKMQQYGAVIRFGAQTRAGRFVLDLYTGIGMKVVPSLTTSLAINDSSSVCAILPTTHVRNIESRNTEVEVVLNAGVQIGLRANNRERKFMERKKEEQESDFPETPPQF